MGTDPVHVLDYVLRRAEILSGRDAAADITDAAVLWSVCWWRERERERRLLRAGRRYGLSRAALGAALGIRTPRGFQGRLDRLDALLGFGARDEARIRVQRSVQRRAVLEQRWLEHHRGDVLAALAALLAQGRRVAAHVCPDPRDTEEPAEELGEEPWLAQLDADYHAGRLTPATMARASLAVGELSASPQVQQLDARHRLHAAMRRVQLLRAEMDGAVHRAT